MTSIILASGSASRRAILTGAGVPFTVERPNVDEEALKVTYNDKAPGDLALALAREKGASVDGGDSVIIAADQVMEFDGQRYDKPKSREELRERLGVMAGKSHFLRGAVAIYRSGQIIDEITESSELTMRSLTPGEIDTYLGALDDAIALGTVGGYALEGLGARLFSEIKGDFFAILGLPLLPVLATLRREGALTW